MNIILADFASPYSTNELFNKLGISISNAVKQKSNKRSKSSYSPTSNEISEGRRNCDLTSIAGTMRRRGLGFDAISAALLTTNKQQVNPPLPESEVMQIAESVMRYEPSDDSAAIMQSLNDVGNSKRFEKMYLGQLYFVHGWNIWIIWHNNRWIKDDFGIYAYECAKKVASSIFIEAASQNNLDVMRLLSRHANVSNSLPRINAMIEIASHVPNLCISANDTDKNQMLIGVANGVVNLRKGNLEENISDNFITHYSNVTYDKNAKCPTFIKFINKIFKDDKEKIAFIKRIIGYCLTGSTDEQVYFFFFGFGANGKSTLLRVIELLLGSSLAKQTPAETLMANLQGNKQTNDLARLQGVRVVIANEVEDGSRLAESLVKQITGGDTVTARYLFKEYFEYRPVFKLIIAGNHKPIIKSSDNGIWRRTVLVDFPVSIPKADQDADLPNKLEAEVPGILNWAIEGCLEWQEIGLAIPDSVTSDIVDYKNEMDWLGQWMADSCILGETLEENATKLYLSYKAWSECNGMRPTTATTFGRRLVERGFIKTRRSDGNWYKGISLALPARM